MAKIPVHDPKDTEVLSPLMAGFSEALSILSGVLNMNTKDIKGVALEKMTWINSKGATVVGVLYQATEGNRLWLNTPSPVIRKNGSIISPQTDHFTIDPIGGGIFFQEEYALLESDNLTVDATVVTNSSKALYDILNDISDLKEKAAHDKGFYENDAALKEAHPTGVAGDFAIVGTTDTMWVWDTDTQAWVDSHKATDFSNYYNKSEVNNLLSQKEPTLNPKGDTVNDDDYYYGGRKQWIDLLYKVRNTSLTGLDTSAKTAIEAVDTVLSALGKLQGQINDVVQKNTDQDSSISSLRDNKADKTELPNDVISLTLTVEGWQQSSEGIYKQSITNENITDNMKLNLSFTTDSMIKTLMDAGIGGLIAENDAGTASVILYGEKPTIEIPVQIELIKIKEVL